MFGLSLSKVLFTIFIAVVVWKGFALVTRLANERRSAAVRNDAKKRAEGPRTVELVECSRCGAYFDPRQGCSCGVRREGRAS